MHSAILVCSSSGCVLTLGGRRLWFPRIQRRFSCLVMTGVFEFLSVAIISQVIMEEEEEGQDLPHMTATCSTMSTQPSTRWRRPTGPPSRLSWSALARRRMNMWWPLTSSWMLSWRWNSSLWCIPHANIFIHSWEDAFFWAVINALLTFPNCQYLMILRLFYPYSIHMYMNWFSNFP